MKVSIDKRKLEKAVKEQAEKVLNNRAYDMKCPYCQASVSVRPGISLCPSCGKEIDFRLNISYK